jgi:leader peptidase (prepilin peptidase)/N-methyltransferase
MVRILATAFAALTGLAFGSFLNVCLSRWPEGESIVKPRSHCRSCGRTLAWWENIPLLSWVALRGRCRTCREWISWRYPLVELVVAVLWADATWQYIPQILEPVYRAPVVAYFATDMIVTMIFYWLVVALAALDAENYWLPDWMTLPGILLGLFLVTAYGAVNVVSGVHDAVYGSVPKMMAVEAGQAALKCIIGIFCAGLLILLIRWLYKLIRKREGVGLGDAKLMAMLAAWLGLEGALLSFFLGVAIGSIVALITLVTRSKRESEKSWALQKLPLGTFLCIGGIVSALWGQPIIAAYLRWAGF